MALQVRGGWLGVMEGGLIEIQHIIYIMIKKISRPCFGGRVLKKKPLEFMLKKLKLFGIMKPKA